MKDTTFGREPAAISLIDILEKLEPYYTRKVGRFINQTDCMYRDVAKTPSRSSLLRMVLYNRRDLCAEVFGHKPVLCTHIQNVITTRYREYLKGDR